jgi:hypothetical protein
VIHNLLNLKLAKKGYLVIEEYHLKMYNDLTLLFSLSTPRGDIILRDIQREFRSKKSTTEQKLCISPLLKYVGTVYEISCM